MGEKGNKYETRGETVRRNEEADHNNDDQRHEKQRRERL